ncbi:MAG: hypothetical protein AAFY52_10005 [Pseudomonadota bacterium]
MVRWGVSVLVAVWLAAGAQAATIQNGDFETGDLTGWTISEAFGGSTLVQDVAPFDTTGAGASNALRLQVGGPGRTGGIARGIYLSQTIAITTGGLHRFRADFAFDWSAAGSNAYAGEVQLFADGVRLDRFGQSFISGGSVFRGTLEGDLDLNVGNIELSLLFARRADVSPNVGFHRVDNISVVGPAPVPLPGGLPLLLAGIGTIYVVRRRRRR